MSILKSKKRKYRKYIHGACQGTHLLGWIIFPTSLIQIVNDPVLDFLIGVGISFIVGLGIQKALKC